MWVDLGGSASSVVLGMAETQGDDMRSGYLGLFFLFFLAFPPGGLAALAQPGPLDLFPLAPGSRYRYEYVSRSEFSGKGPDYRQETRVDSGLVEYVIIDSLSAGGMVRNWSIEERTLILHHVWGRYSAGSAGDVYYDSSYWRASHDATLKLSESLTGDHELVCNAVVWTFPPSSTPTVPIVRYSYLSPFQVRPTVPGGPLSGIQDTLWFVAGKGLTRAGRESWSYTYTSSVTRARMNLLAGSTEPLDSSGSLPYVLSLLPNYPNPFNPSTVIQYTLGTPGEISLILYDVLGREVKVLESGYKQSGRHRVTLDGGGLAAGLYIYRLSTMNGEVSRKALLVR
jgi:hypothetical protein